VIVRSSVVFPDDSAIPEVSAIPRAVNPANSMNSNGKLSAELTLPISWSNELKLKIERRSHKGKTTIFLIGRFDAEHLEELRAQVSISSSQIVLDLREVTSVDVDVVRFLVACKADGATILHCSRYIRQWMVQER
jgi:hypothetical protein